MYLFIDFCGVNPLIGWLLSGLLGLLLGWLIWGRLRSRITELEESNRKLISSNKSLGAELESAQADSASHKSDVSMLNGRVREKEVEARELASSLAACQEKNRNLLASGGMATPSEEVQGIADISDEVAPEPEIIEEVAEEPTPEPEIVEEVVEEPAPVEPPSAPSPEPLTAVSPSRPNLYAALKNDDLQIVEGIGPKMNEVLTNAGIKNWSVLATKSTADLRAILDSVNQKRYRIIDPSPWPTQARLADEGKWDELIAMQKGLSSGRKAGAQGETDSKVEKLLIKLGVLKRWKQDDLTAVEGIGPKISGLLKADGIDTWRKLANSEVSRIQGLLDAAGKRYKLADPSTWPKQAEMAADGRWDDLSEYQDFLQGGK